MYGSPPKLRRKSPTAKPLAEMEQKEEKSRVLSLSFHKARDKTPRAQRFSTDSDAGSIASAAKKLQIASREKKKMDRRKNVSCCNIYDKIKSCQNQSGLVARQSSNLSICTLFAEERRKCLSSFHFKSSIVTAPTATPDKELLDLKAVLKEESHRL